MPVYPLPIPSPSFSPSLHPSLPPPSSPPSLPSGGDLSYHLEKEGRFQLPRVRLYLAEIALALEYLREKKIIHRDVKPANMLLDSQGHIHLTDFNVACIVRPNIPVTSTTGTKPYMGERQRPHLLTPPPAQHPPSTLSHMLTILSHSHTHIYTHSTGGTSPNQYRVYLCSGLVESGCLCLRDA